MSKFHITITDTEKGESILDTDTCAIIGAVDRGDHTQTLCFTHCRGLDLTATAVAAMQAVNHSIKDMPRPLVKMIKAFGNEKD